MGKLIDITSRLKQKGSQTNSSREVPTPPASKNGQGNSKANSPAKKSSSDLNKKPTVKIKGIELKNSEVMDITEARQAQINRDRRVVKRTILSEFIGACAILPDRGLMKVTIYDISDNGVSFDVGGDEGHFQQGEEVAMRVYMNHKTYFPFVVKVANVRRIDDEGVIRHGANFVKGTINDVALHHFVKFIETVSASLKTDAGDVLVSNLS